MTRKLRILILTTSFEYGGCEKTIISLAQGLNRNKFEVTVASLLGPGRVTEILKSYSIPQFSLNMRGGWDIGVVRRLGSFLDSHKIDILHSFLFHSNLVGRFTSRWYRVPVNISTTRTMEMGSSWHLIVDRLTKSWVDYELVNSDRIRDFLINKTGSNPDTLTRIYNGIRIPQVSHQQKQAVSQQLRLTGKERVVGTVGSLEPAKNHELFLRTAKCILRQRQDVLFFIAGEGRARARLQRQIHRQGLQQKVFLLGFRQDIPAFLSVLDVFLFTSAWEGFPNVILEALASQVPVVSSNAGGISEIIDANENGKLLSALTPEPYAEAVLSLLQNPEAARRLALAGFNKVRQAFTVERMVQEFEQVYLSLAKKHGLPEVMS